MRSRERNARVGRRPARLGLSRCRQGIKTGPASTALVVRSRRPDHVTSTEEHEHCTPNMLADLPGSSACGILGLAWTGRRCHVQAGQSGKPRASADLCRQSANCDDTSSATTVYLLHRRDRRLDRFDRPWRAMAAGILHRYFFLFGYIFGLFVPNVIIAASIAYLACAYRAGRVYAAVKVYLDWPGDAGRSRSHRQFALRPDGTPELVA